MAEIDDRLHRLGHAFVGRVPQDRLDFYHEEIDAGEETIALECLCDNLYDYDVSVPQDVYQEIVILSRMLGVDQRRWSILKIE